MWERWETEASGCVDKTSNALTNTEVLCILEEQRY